MRNRAQVETALELVGMMLSKQLDCHPPITPKVKLHMEGVAQSLQWVLDPQSPNAHSLTTLLESAAAANEDSTQSYSI